MTYPPTALAALRASVRAEAEREDTSHLELTTHEALALLDALDETEALLDARTQPAPLTPSSQRYVEQHQHQRDDLAAQRAKRVHLRGERALVSACGLFPVEHLTSDPQLVTCKGCQR